MKVNIGGKKHEGVSFPLSLSCGGGALSRGCAYRTGLVTRHERGTEKKLLGISTRSSAVVRGAARRRRNVSHDERESGRLRKDSTRRHLNPYAVVTRNRGVEEHWYLMDT